MKDQAHNLKQLLFDGPAREPQVTVYAVVSGKGGVGKSNISLNLALEMHRCGRRVLLIDGDTGMANLDILAGVAGRHSMINYFEDELPLEDILIEIQPGFHLLPGGSGLSGLQSQSREEIRSFVDDLMGRSYDVILIDAGAGVNAKLLSFVSFSHELILVTVPEPTAMADAYSLAKILSVYSIKEEVGVVINQVSGRREALETYERLEKVITTFLNLKVRFLGYVSSDPKVRRAVNLQRPFSEAFPSSAASRDIGELCSVLLDGAQIRRTGTLADTVSRFMKVFS